MHRRPQSHEIVTCLIERISGLGHSVPAKILQSLSAHEATDDLLISISQEVIDRRAAGGEPAPKPRSELEPLASDVEGFLHDHPSFRDYVDYGLWISGIIPRDFFDKCAAAPERSILDLILSDDEHVFCGTEDVLFRGLNPESFAAEPWRSRLAGVNALAVAGGLLRLSDLASVLTYGTPPTDRYSPDERALFLEFDDSQTRRAARAWDKVSEFVDDLGKANNRAERLVDLWLLHPMSPTAGAYLNLLYRCYVNGQHPESVILCRSLLERTISDKINELRLHGETMPKKIRALEKRGVLSHRVAEMALSVLSRGNKAIHVDPGIISDAFETISDTLMVMSATTGWIDPSDHGSASAAGL